MGARVAIDGFNLALPEGTGVATYGRALAEQLRALGHSVEGLFGLPGGGDPQMREVTFFEGLERGVPDRFEEWPAPLRRLARRVVDLRRPLVREVPGGWVERRPFAHRLPAFDRLWTAHALFARAERHFGRTGRFLPVRVPDPPAVMHWTYPIPARVPGARNLYTLHDLVPLRLPYATLDRKRRYRRLVRRCAREADALVTVSEASRRDIAHLLGVDPARVRNTYQALPGGGAPADGAARVLGLEPGGFFLFFGAVEPKKNVGRLLEAFLQSGVEAPLVLAGSGWSAGRDLRLLGDERTRAGRRVGRRVIRLDYLPRRLLLGLVRDARAVLFPSLYEGFGLPVLEAMAMGVPVLTSAEGSLAEVAGDAALLVDPYDVGSIAAGIRRLDGDAALRADLARRGPAQAELFSAERYRERLGALYDDVLSRPSRK